MRLVVLIILGLFSELLWAQNSQLVPVQEDYLARLEMESSECVVGSTIKGKLTLVWPPTEQLDLDLLRQLPATWVYEIDGQESGVDAGLNWRETQFRVLVTTLGECEIPALTLSPKNTPGEPHLVLAQTQPQPLLITSGLKTITPQDLAQLEAPGPLKADPFKWLRWAAILLVVVLVIGSLLFWRQVRANKPGELWHSIAWYRDQIGRLSTRLETDAKSGAQASSSDDQGLRALADETQALFSAGLHQFAELREENEGSAPRALRALKDRFQAQSLPWEEDRLAPTLRELEGIRYRRTKISAPELSDLLARIELDLVWLNNSLVEEFGASK